MRPVNNISGGQVGRSRLVDLLLRDGRQRLNNGTVAGGLAHVLQQGMRGYQIGKARDAEQAQQQQEADATSAMVRGMSAKQWVPPEGEQVYAGDAPGSPALTREEQMARAAPAGGYEGGIAALQGLGTPAANSLTARLLTSKMSRDQSLADRNAELMQVYDPQSGGMVYRPRGEVGSGMPSAPPDVEKFTGAPFEAIGADGTPGLYLRGNRGTMRPVEGLSPMPQNDGMVWAFDSEENATRLVPRSEVAGNGNRYSHPSAAPSDRYVSRRRPVDDTSEVFEVSQDGGKTWAAVGDPYKRGGDPMDAMLSAMFGNPQAALDAGNNAPAPVETGSGANDNLYRQAAEAMANGADAAAVRQRLLGQGGNWSDFLRWQSGAAK